MMRTPAGVLPWAGRRRLRTLAGLERPETRIRVADRALGILDRHSRRMAWTAGLLAAALAGSAAGFVAGLVAGVYTGIAVTTTASVRRSRARRQAIAVALDLIAMMAAELRAGGDPGRVIGASINAVRATGVHGRILADRVGAAARVADAVGARLADLIERLEIDARTLASMQAQAAAQAAGARATSWLLAALPIAGLALGFGIGVDPVRILLHTTVGASCATAALGFQTVGLAWSNRLVESILDSVR